MGRFIRIVIMLAAVLAAAAVVSYAGARIKLAQYLGSDLPNLGPLDATFSMAVEELGTRPAAWVFTYARSPLQGLPRMTIYVSPLGDILGTRPGNLKARVEPYRQRLP